MVESGLGKRKRADSSAVNPLSEYDNYKRMKGSGDATWAKIDKMMSKTENELVLF